MNKLSTEKRAQIIRCLVEGNSIRSTVRITDAAKNTASMIEESKTNSDNGVAATAEVTNLLNDIVEGIEDQIADDIRNNANIDDIIEGGSDPDVLAGRTGCHGCSRGELCPKRKRCSTEEMS